MKHWYNRDDDAPKFPPEVQGEIKTYVAAALAHVAHKRERRAKEREWNELMAKWKSQKFAKRAARRAAKASCGEANG